VTGPYSRRTLCVQQWYKSGREVVFVAEQAKILVVDDDPDITESLSLVLEGAGYDVEVANTPEDAVRKAEEWQPSLILLDVMMPDGTEGFHFVWKLRNEYDAPLSEVPIVILSAIHSTTRLRFYPDQTDGKYEPGEFLPVQGFIDKPVKPTALLRKVRDTLAADA